MFDNIEIERIFREHASLICDCHIHVGEFENEFYYSPEDIVKEIESLSLSKWAVSSTTSISGNYKKANSEICELYKLSSDNIKLFLWITPFFMINQARLKNEITHPINGFKIHAFANSWLKQDEYLHLVFQQARNGKIPILIHTGNLPAGPEAITYESYCVNYPDVNIILAHGRPLDQTIYLLKRYENIFVDTAYMPIQEIAKIYKILGKDKIVFGSDYPVDKYFFPDESSLFLYKKKIVEMIKEFGAEKFENIVSDNFELLFRNSYNMLD